MLHRWRRWLAWALVLWLPLHGGAALAIGLCAAMQLQAAAPVAAAAEHCHGHGGAERPAGPAAAAGADEPGVHEGGACAHCAACQVQAAAVPATPALTQQPPPAGWTSAAPQAPPQRAPDALERPPRTALA